MLEFYQSPAQPLNYSACQTQSGLHNRVFCRKGVPNVHDPNIFFEFQLNLHSFRKPRIFHSNLCFARVNQQFKKQKYPAAGVCPLTCLIVSELHGSDHFLCLHLNIWNAHLNTDVSACWENKKGFSQHAGHCISEPPITITIGCNDKCTHKLMLHKYSSSFYRKHWSWNNETHT